MVVGTWIDGMIVVGIVQRELSCCDLELAAGWQERKVVH